MGDLIAYPVFRMHLMERDIFSEKVSKAISKLEALSRRNFLAMQKPLTDLPKLNIDKKDVEGAFLKIEGSTIYAFRAPDDSFLAAKLLEKAIKSHDFVFVDGPFYHKFMTPLMLTALALKLAYPKSKLFAWKDKAYTTYFYTAWDIPEAYRYPIFLKAIAEDFLRGIFSPTTSLEEKLLVSHAVLQEAILRKRNILPKNVKILGKELATNTLSFWQYIYDDRVYVNDSELYAMVPSGLQYKKGLEESFSFAYNNTVALKRTIYSIEEATFHHFINDIIEARPRAITLFLRNNDYGRIFDLLLNVYGAEPLDPFTFADSL